MTPALQPPLPPAPGIPGNPCSGNPTLPGGMPTIPNGTPTFSDLTNPMFPGFIHAATSRLPHHPPPGTTAGSSPPTTLPPSLESALPCFAPNSLSPPVTNGSTPGVNPAVSNIVSVGSNPVQVTTSTTQSHNLQQSLGNNNNNSSSCCHGCLSPIVDNVYLSVADFTTWHVPCLRCSDCNVGLDSEKSCFIKIGKYLCKKCYQRRFKSPSTPSPAVCARCNNKIHAKEMVMHAKEFVYHVSCFNCTHCSRLLTTGDHFGMKDSLIFCRQHFEMLSSPPLSLPSGTPLSLPSGTPQLPQTPISSTSLPLGGIQPPHDFPHLPPNLPPPHSGVGGNPLSAIQAGYNSQPPCSPFNPNHVQPPPQVPMGFPGSEGIPPPGGYPIPPQSQGDPTALMSHTPTPPKSQKGRPKKKKPPQEDAFQNLYANDFNSAGLHGAHDAVLGLYMAATNPAGVPGGAGGLEQQSRTKRVRTSFKNHQLRVLKQYFQLNHNPDAKELKQLSQKTGLSKRVLQVWFQNARAKYRRLMMKNQQNGTNTKFTLDDETPENEDTQNMKISESDDELNDEEEKQNSINNPNSPSAESMSDFGEMLSPDLSPEVTSPTSGYSINQQYDKSSIDESLSSNSNFSLQDAVLNPKSEPMTAF
ncbi:uncharacterized protein LOC142336848 isoform X2 [Convolutriloba macropyga]